MSSVPQSALVRRGRLLVSAQAWILAIAALLVLCGEYSGGLRPATLRGWVFLLGARLSSAASLSLVPGLLLLAASALGSSRRGLAALHALLWPLVIGWVYVDTRIYGLFRFHFNALVWNVLTTPGADEAVHVSAAELAWTGLTLLTLVPLTAVAFLALWRRAVARASVSPSRLGPALIWKAVLVPDMLLVAGLYAWGDLDRDPQVMAYAQVYPLYPRVTVKRLASRVFGLELKERERVDMPASGILMAYPRSPVLLSPEGPRPNVVVIVIDSLRADMLQEEVMPRTCALARRGRTFMDHLSGGNATRFGVFSLVYGLHGSYWKSVYDEHRSPVLVDALLQQGYEPHVFTSASMDFPEFRSTAWVRIEDQVEDRLHSDRPGGRDDRVVSRFAEWLEQRKSPAAPFFAFLLLDAPHQDYSFPEDCALFRPYAEGIRYSSIDSDPSPELRTGLLNRYRNAVHYSDRMTGEILDTLERAGQTEATIVVVTGDHGEEFFEHGFFGHTSNFTRAQAHVPFVMAGPQIPPGIERRPTSHVDLAATLLEILGADPAHRGDWTLGENLMDPPAARERVVSGWDELGLHVGSAILAVSTAGYGGARIAVYDQDWRPVFDDSALLAASGQALGRLALDCRRFLK